MAELYPVAGAKIYIGGVLETKSTNFVEGDFSGQVWTQIDGWRNQGRIGDTATLITTPMINRSRELKQKGTSNAGQMQNQFAVLEDDAGQIALIAAAAPTNNQNYAFKIELSNGAERLFIGLVMNAEEAGGEANTVAMLDCTIEVNSNIVRVAAP